MIYLWVKAFHIISMVAWFAGLFYIFRLFVYHVKHKDNVQMAKTYTVMERKLLRIIMLPAMFATFFFGFWMIRINPEFLVARWFQFKLLGVFLLVGYHLFAHMTHERFSQKEYFLSEKACRLINEIPTLLLFIIVILVVVRPF